MRIYGDPDIVSLNSRDVRILGPHWIASAAAQFCIAADSPERHIVLDLSNIDFLRLFEWSTTVAMLQRILKSHPVSSIGIDLIGPTTLRLPSEPQPPKSKTSKHVRSEYTNSEYALADRVYPLVDFMESVGTRDVLKSDPERTSDVFYPGVEVPMLSSEGRYSKKGRHTVLFGLTRIDSKNDCRQFLDDHRILNWRSAMSRRFDQSPLFESEEIWRVLCHELSVNIWEHSKWAGFLCARIVEEPIYQRKLRPWCSLAYGSLLELEERSMAKGFLELCVVDPGEGFVSTLKNAYLERSGVSEAESTPADILCFAFDEFGTSKSDDESWATERHALGRILQVVAKYGGFLSLRSGGAEVFFRSRGRGFERIPNHLGYRPESIGQFPSDLWGAQLQIILPLNPLIDLKRRREFRPLLNSTLPESFRIEPDQARGHLIPLREELEQTVSGVGKEDQKAFRLACEKLSREKMKRPANEAFVLDFSDLNWSAGQFETLLHLLQNALQNRPVLLVEIDPQLAKEVDELERQSAPTQLNSTDFEISEKVFLETFSRVSSPLLGLDQNGRRYLFGLSFPKYKDALLKIVETEASVEELSTELIEGERLKKSTLQIVLNQTSSVFEVSENALGKPVWRTLWDARSLATESSRAISRHFDQVADRSGAWRGARKPGSKTPAPKFHLTWLSEWRADFLEASRILSRERHADEIAQRLIFRLRIFLESQNGNIHDIRAIACVTTPAMLLAAALHRWWPVEPRPALADLGYYVMLNDGTKQLPMIVRSGKIIVLQDVLDTHQISGDLVATLTEQGIEVACVCGFVQLVEGLQATHATSVTQWWKPGVLSPPHHAMIQTRRPDQTSPPQNAQEDAHAFWIEPRALHPFRYKTMRRDFAPGRDPLLDRRDYYLHLFDDHAGGSLLTAGHYVYGERHYVVTLDIRRALTGHLGNTLAHWLAHICEGMSDREKQVWESERGYSLRGDVTAVLMPLHSQVHYVWPQVENLLAQRGRRQPKWWLESTLFTGAGPHYLLPSQLINQIRAAVRNSIESTRGPEELIEHPLRILMLDDAIVTARTAEDILATVFREIRKAYAQISQELRKPERRIETCPSPVEWIRYFAFLNQMNNSSHTIWHSIPAIGVKKIPIVFEEFAPFLGVPVYNEQSCPVCRDLSRLKSLSRKCEQLISTRAEQWTNEHIAQLLPIAVDSPDFQPHTTITLKKPIEVLTTALKLALKPEKFRFLHADTAIWSFYDLMYWSYPPNDVLRSLGKARSPRRSVDSPEYERYRWTVLSWCLHNWSRIKANGAQGIFIHYANLEVEEGSDLVCNLLEKASVRATDPHIIQFVAGLIKQLAKLERHALRVVNNPTSRTEKITLLTTALTLFFLNIPRGQLFGLRVHRGLTSISLMSYLDRASRPLDSGKLVPSFLRNLYRTVTRPERHADPTWTLETLAEALFRGRDPRDPIVSNHELLPRLIRDVRTHHSKNEAKRELLRTSLALFMAALEDIRPHCGGPLASSGLEIQAMCAQVIEWLKLANTSRNYTVLPKELSRLEDALAVDGEFCTSFNQAFHKDVKELGNDLELKYTANSTRLSFTYVAEGVVERCRVLTNVQTLLVCLANRAIDPIIHKRGKAKYSSSIEVRHESRPHETDRLVFRLLTNFATLDDTIDLINKGPSGHAELAMLKTFGATFGEILAPSSEEAARGFTTAFEISTLAGFVPRSLR